MAMDSQPSFEHAGASAPDGRDDHGFHGDFGVAPRVVEDERGGALLSRDNVGLLNEVMRTRYQPRYQTRMTTQATVVGGGRWLCGRACMAIP